MVEASAITKVDGPRLIEASTTELQSLKYTTPNIQAALEALHQDGFVVLKSVVDAEHIKNLNAYMSKEADELLKNNAKPFNQGVNCASRLTPLSPIPHTMY